MSLVSSPNTRKVDATISTDWLPLQLLGGRRSMHNGRELKSLQNNQTIKNKLSKTNIGNASLQINWTSLGLDASCSQNNTFQLNKGFWHSILQNPGGIKMMHLNNLDKVQNDISCVCAVKSNYSQTSYFKKHTCISSKYLH